MSESKEEIAKKAVVEFREIIQCKTTLIDRVESLLARFPADVIPKAYINDLSDDRVVFYHLNREQVIEAMKAAGAGKWEKGLNPDGRRINYTATIDGIRFEIYGAPPPASCRIVEEEIEVPAHKEIKRTLVCI